MPETHTDGEILKGSRPGRESALRKSAMKKNPLNLLNQYFPNLYDHGSFNFSGICFDMPYNTSKHRLGNTESSNNVKTLISLPIAN